MNIDLMPLRRLHERLGVREDAARLQPAGIRAA
jgi:hypothetical protein